MTEPDLNAMTDAEAVTIIRKMLDLEAGMLRMTSEDPDFPNKYHDRAAVRHAALTVALARMEAGRQDGEDATPC
jgi:hypothetical protein